MSYPTRTVVLRGTATSGRTSDPLCVADYAVQALSWETSADTTGSLTVQGTLANGFTAAIAAAEWSTLSTVAAQGQFTLDAGSQWIRVVLPANEPDSTVRFSGQY